MVDYIREKYGDRPADWAKKNWTGEHGRMCICHARYSGCNNNLNTEVDFRDIKEVSAPWAGISTFAGGLVHYI